MGRGPRAQKVVDRVLRDIGPVDLSVQLLIEATIEKTLAYQVAAFQDACADFALLALARRRQEGRPSRTRRSRP